MRIREQQNKKDLILPSFQFETTDEFNPASGTNPKKLFSWKTGTPGTEGDQSGYHA